MESRWGTPPSSPGPSQGQPKHPREPPKHGESCDPSPGESLAHPDPPRPGGQRTHLGRWWEASASTGVPPVQEGQMPTLSSLTGYSYA